MQIDGKIRGRKWVSITSCFFVGGGEEEEVKSSLLV